MYAIGPLKNQLLTVNSVNPINSVNPVNPTNPS